MDDFTVEIAGHALEYFDADHVYLVDGMIVPSITQLLGVKFAKRFDGIDIEVLKRAAEAGTAVHKAIENYCKTGEERDLPELRNFKFLQKKIGFEVCGNEIPVILFLLGEPVAAGRFDLLLDRDGKSGIADIKRTSTLDKEYLAAQLNLYRQATIACYNEPIDFLAGIHLKEDVRKFVEIPIWEDQKCELYIAELLKGWKEKC